MSGFLPITKKEMRERGITQFDFVYVIGDAYVDHPSFGHAIISRLLESHGYSVGIISQPDWKNDESIAIFGEPRLGFLVSAGNMDSMVNHYSVSKKRRQTDAYTPGGVMGKRPDRALTVYSNLIRRTCKRRRSSSAASKRACASGSLRLLEQQPETVCASGFQGGYPFPTEWERGAFWPSPRLWTLGIAVSDIGFIPGTVYKTQHLENVYDYKLLPSFEVLQADKTNYAKSFYVQYCNTDSITGKRLVEPYPNKIYVVQNPPAAPLSQEEMDEVYAYPYMRTYHPSYEKLGGVPAIPEIKFSLVSNRGCFGGCSFCALTFHQGRIIQTRSHESIVEEAKLLTQEPDFKGYIHDVGGPTADFRVRACQKQETRGVCPNRQYLFPSPARTFRPIMRII